MSKALRILAEEATRPTPWQLGDEVLYTLCRRHPDHRTVDVVLAKVLLIGRAYAAAIERRKSDRHAGNDDFYLKSVAPKIIASKIDSWIESAKRLRPGSADSLRPLVEIHGWTTDLFSTISGLKKRSLASKYLHFHVPRLFFLYDSRAVEGLRRVKGALGKASQPETLGDPEYARFAGQCLRLSEHCRVEFGIALTPRELDNLLLALALEPVGDLN